MECSSNGPFTRTERTCCNEVVEKPMSECDEADKKLFKLQL